MSVADFNRFRVTQRDIAERLNVGRAAEAADTACARAAETLSDYGLALLATGQVEPALDHLWQAFKIDPFSRWAFHNFVAASLKYNRLRGDTLDAVVQFIMDYFRRLPWLMEYRNLVFAPRFLNLQFVGGKCNLSCRMCCGTRSPGHTNKLVYLSGDEFEKILEAAPTACSCTMSSGDSDPLLHPELERIIEIANRRRVTFDLYTNGHALDSRAGRRIVDSQIVRMVNFSIDAATPDTYQRIRGADFDRVVRKIEMLQAMKAERNRVLPMLSMSFVAMADNIQELPAFVKLALRLGANRVYVEHLGGWENGAGGNYAPTCNSRWPEYVNEAQQAAAGTALSLVLPGQLLGPEPAKQRTCQPPTPQPSPPDPRGPGAPRESLTPEPASGSYSRRPQPETSRSPSTRQNDWCDWLQAVWVNKDGSLNPCCTVAGVCDMGNIHEGPLLENPKFIRVKSLLLAGKVFEACLRGNCCDFIRRQQAAGRTPPIITKADLGDLYRETPPIPQHRTSPEPLHEPTRSDELAIAGT